MKNTVSNKKSWLFLGFLFLSWSVLAWLPNDSQTNEAIPYPYRPIDSTYTFIRYQSNTIYQDEKTVLGTFFNQLDSLKNGQISKVNILHIGDSHIQADLFTDKIRKKFQDDAAFGNGGYGLAYPYAIAKTNNPTWYKSSFTGNWETCKMNHPAKNCDWGIGGINATTDAISATFTVQLCAYKSRCYDFNTIRIYSDFSDSTLFTPTFKNPESGATLSIQSIQKDALQGYISYQLNETVSGITIGFTKTNSRQNQFTLKGFALQNSAQKGIVYHSIGLNSATANTFMRNENFIEQTSSLGASLIVISLGTNDAYSKYFQEEAFYKSFSLLLTKLRASNPKASIILTAPADSYRARKYPNINFTITPKILQALAKEYHCGFWNLAYVMGGYKSINKWHQKKLCQNDKLHFNRQGYELQADLFYDALMKSYSQFK